MNERKRKSIVYIVFALAVIWAIFNFPSAKKHQSTFNNDDYADEPEETAVSLKSENPGSAQISYAGDWGEDPFVWRAPSGNAPSRDTYDFSLTAISEANGDYWALVNGKVMAVGDQIDGWTLTKVNKRGAVLSKSGKTIELTIKGT